MSQLYSELFQLVKSLADGNENAMMELDRHGLFAAPGEDCKTCASRLQKWLDANAGLVKNLKNGHCIELDDGIKTDKNDFVPEKLKTPAAEKTENLYGFAVDWVPGFFLRSGVGLLWGGCAWHDDRQDITVFALRNSFRTSPDYLVYNRDELIAHESCHAARSPMGNDWQLEEFFAYRTSSRSFRRYMGNCFILKSDALVFLAPAFLVLLQQILRTFCFPGFPFWPAWTVLVLSISYLLCRNQFARNRFFRAKKNIMKFYSLSGTAADSFLFRCTWQEISAIAGVSGKNTCSIMLKNTETCDLRRRTALKRFIPELMEVKNA